MGRSNVTHLEAQKKYKKTTKGKVTETKYRKSELGRTTRAETGARYRKRYRADIRSKYHNLRKEILTVLGGKCRLCGFDDWRALQVDHVLGGGHQEMRLQRNPIKYLGIIQESMEKNEGKYQLLCANCNWIKREENKELYRGLTFGMR